MLRLIVSVIAVALIQVLTAIGLLLQCAPRIVQGLWQAARAFMAFSCITYRALFEFVERRQPRLALTQLPWRGIASVCLSIVFALGAWFACGWVITIYVFGGAALHGLLVAWAWDQLSLPHGQSLGR
jgi:hypothetical protein